MNLATDASDTLPIDIETAATPPLPCVMVSPVHCSDAKRDMYQNRDHKAKDPKEEVENDSSTGAPPNSENKTGKLEKDNHVKGTKEDYTSSDEEATLDMLTLIGSK